MDHTNVNRVIVVCKTHLDIGFTDFAQAVLDNYVHSFIPRAMALAEEVNTPEKKRFLWTVGSYLPYYYLNQASPEEAAAFCRAVDKGHIRWHGLPCTTHTELMDGRLFDWGLALAEGLNARFGLTSIAAKMTDVPGHTVAIVPRLARKGIKYLHIGVNDSSRLPRVPALFRWQLEGAEIIVHYAGGYGADQVLPTGVALEFLHSGDNMGPPCREDLEAFYQRMAEKYPNARIEAGTLDDFAREVLPLKDTLPVITEEIGDTWIHGVATDPVKVSIFRRILENLPEAPPQEVMENLLLTAEHTWGMDTKLHLRDYKNYEKTAFLAAKAADTVPSDAMAATAREAQLEALVRRDHPGDFLKSASYSRFEASHAEQRAYAQKALAALPGLEGELAWSAPEKPADLCPYEPGKTLTVGPWTFRLGEGGELEALTHRSGFGGGTIGAFRYQRFGAKTVDGCLERYGRNLEQTRYWAEFDFGKPGLRYTPLQEDRTDIPIPEGFTLAGDTLTVFLHGPAEACETAGCPRDIRIRYRFSEDRIVTTLYLMGKDPMRAPEALWLHMNPTESDRWLLRKMGTCLSPTAVVSGGNRQMHTLEALVLPEALELRSIDAPLVSIGRPNLYAVDDRIEDVRQGFWFCLYNNRWGTNFPQWFGSDMRWEFTLTLQEGSK